MDTSAAKGEYVQRRIAPDDLQVVSEPAVTPSAKEETRLPQQLAELRLLQSVLDSMGDALVVVSTDLRVVLCNPAARLLFTDNLLDMRLEQWTDRYEMWLADKTTPISDAERPLGRAVQGETVDLEDVYVVDTATDQDVWLSITTRPIYDEYGIVQGAFGVFRDITARKRAEEEMRFLNRAMASASEGITITDAQEPRRPIVYVNQGFERLTGYAAQAIIGKDLRFIQGPGTDGKAVNELDEAVREGHPATIEMLHYRKDGTPFWNRVSVTPVRDEQGRLTHFVAVHSDITAIKRTEDRLRAARDQLQATNKRMKRNLDAAAEVQKALLPTKMPRFAWGSFAWRLEPCDELAGDILNVFRLDHDHIGAYVLDVCGHGVAAALLSVTVRRFLSPSFSPTSLVLHQSDTSARRIVPPAEVANQLNQRFAWDANRGQFFTLFYSILNTKTGKLRYVIAGHPPPLLLNEDGQAGPLKGSGFPIGISQEPYTEQVIQLRGGDRLLIYSDGLTDAMNRQRKLFGEERAIRTLMDYRDESIEDTLSGTMQRVKDWCGGARFKDDVSVLALDVQRDFLPKQTRPRRIRRVKKA